MNNSDSNNLEVFKLLHNLQYDIISRIEKQNNYITSFVTGLSTITIAYSFNGEKSLTTFNGLLLPLVFILANGVAILFLYKSRKFIKMHQSRAEQMRKNITPDFHVIYQSVGKDKKGIFSTRTGYMILLHILISVLSLMIILHFAFDLPLLTPIVDNACCNSKCA